MKKRIIGLSLCCVCIVNAGWYDDAKEKTAKAYDQTVDYANDSYSNAKGKVTDYYLNKEKKEQAELDECIIKLEETLPKYGLFLEKNYMDVNKRNEAKILQSYQRLNTKGINSKLKDKIDNDLLRKLSMATSTLEYTSIILSELKRIKKELKNNNSDKLNEHIGQVKLLMYAWTTPMEILSTKNIYNKSLLGISSSLYKNIKKDNYVNYTKFIYSMLFVNLVNENILIRKDTKLEVASKLLVPALLSLRGIANEDKKGLNFICKEESNVIPNNYLSENFSISLDIDVDKIDKEIYKISKNNNLFEGAMFFDKNITKLEEISIIDNPLNDYWYLMVREYMALQDDFYKMKKEIDQIIKVLSVLPNSEKDIALLKQNMFDVDALYRKFDEAVRYNIIDLPISIYADLYYIEFRKGKKWYNDDEKVMSDISIAYNKACANMQKYMVSEFAINKVMRITRTLKKEFNDKEWSEVKTRAKLTQDWFNMLNKIQIKNK